MKEEVRMASTTSAVSGKELSTTGAGGKEDTEVTITLREQSITR